jgi:hypothetical protein
MRIGCIRELRRPISAQTLRFYDHNSTAFPPSHPTPYDPLDFTFAFPPETKTYKNFENEMRITAKYFDSVLFSHFGLSPE